MMKVSICAEFEDYTESQKRQKHSEQHDSRKNFPDKARNRDNEKLATNVCKISNFPVFFICPDSFELAGHFLDCPDIFWIVQTISGIFSFWIIQVVFGFKRHFLDCPYNFCIIQTIYGLFRHR